MNDILVIIVNYRTAGLAVNCLASLSDQSRHLHGGRVVVVDNNSADGSVETIAAALLDNRWVKWAETVSLARNGGFSFGNNAGIIHALAADMSFSYVMLLNPDATLREGALDQMLAFMADRPKVGIAGCRIENGRGGVECSAHHLPRAIDELHQGARLGFLERATQPASRALHSADAPHPCDWVSGAGMMIRREVIDQIGLFDEGFFLYFEEVDFCRRAKAAGWEVWYAPPSTIVHLEGASTGITKTAQRRPAYWFASRRRFFVKAYGIGTLFLADALRTLGRLSFLVRRQLRLGASTRFDGTPPHFMRDLLWGDIKALFNGELRAIRR